MDPLEGHRKHPAKQPIYESGNRAVILAVTICSAKRKPIFADQQVHDTITKSWQDATAWKVGRYVIMPDHVHLFCSPRNPEFSIQQWIKFWKSRATKNWPNQSDRPIWQKNFWDRQLRQGESYQSKWEYIVANPVKAGFVEIPENWPYQGELTKLDWHDEV